MDAVTIRYAGRVFMRQASGAGPYFGHYRFFAPGAEAGEAAWVVLQKSWPTERLACDDAMRAAHFAIDAENYVGVANRAVEAAALVMTLNSSEPGWSAAVQAERVAANDREVLEARLVGAKERHWPDFRIHSGRPQPFNADSQGGSALGTGAGTAVAGVATTLVQRQEPP